MVKWMQSFVDGCKKIKSPIYYQNRYRQYKFEHSLYGCPFAVVENNDPIEPLEFVFYDDEKVEQLRKMRNEEIMECLNRLLRERERSKGV